MHPLTPSLQACQAAFAKILVYLIAEVSLTLLGLDDVADMGEWEERRRGAMSINQIVQIQ